MTRSHGKPAHSARRTCLGCGVRDEQNHLIRLRIGGQGGLTADDNRTGRGGYLHRARECWARFVRRKSVYRAFHAEIARDAKEALVQELIDRYGELTDGKDESPSTSQRTRNRDQGPHRPAG